MTLAEIHRMQEVMMKTMKQNMLLKTTTLIHDVFFVSEAHE
jgi:hypothetical protein